MSWLSANVDEEIELDTEPPISVHSSPPITVNSSSTHTVFSSSSDENTTYEIAPPTGIPAPTGAETEDEGKDKDEEKKVSSILHMYIFEDLHILYEIVRTRTL